MAISDPHNIFSIESDVTNTRLWAAWRAFGLAVLNLLPPLIKAEATNRGLIKLIKVPGLSNQTGGSKLLTTNVDYHFNSSGQFRPKAGDTPDARKSASAQATRDRLPGHVYFDPFYHPTNDKTLARALGHELIHVADYHAGRITNFANSCEVSASEIKAYTWDRDKSLPGLNITGLDNLAQEQVNIYTGYSQRSCSTTAQ